MDLIFADDSSTNWLHQKYYRSGTNSRYWTWQLALNLLVQTRVNPVIVETGCQRQEDDLGAGMSTSIFGEYCARYGGAVYTVDLFRNHLDICRACTKEWEDAISYVESDSISWLQKVKGIEADLLYLDSLDYPIGDQAGDKDKQLAAQVHCLNEFKAAESSGVLNDSTILLIDDNQLPGGGKPRLLKNHLINTSDWVCLLDLQQSLWMKR